MFASASVVLYLHGDRECTPDHFADFGSFGGVPNTVLRICIGRSGNDLDKVIPLAYVAIVVGNAGDEGLKKLRDAVDTAYAPATLLVVLEGDTKHEQVSRVIPAAVGHTTLDGQAVAYVCDRQMCALPVTEAEALKQILTVER